MPVGRPKLTSEVFSSEGALQTIAMALVETTSITIVSMAYDTKITMVNGL